jgi:hypothetical protein
MTLDDLNKISFQALLHHRLHKIHTAFLKKENLW